jgi:hypothetical protein
MGGKALGQALQRDRLAGAGGAGDQAVGFARDSSSACRSPFAARPMKISLIARPFAPTLHKM